MVLIPCINIYLKNYKILTYFANVSFTFTLFNLILIIYLFILQCIHCEKDFLNSEK